MQCIRLIVHYFGSGYIYQFFIVFVPFFHKTFAFLKTVKKPAARSSVPMLVSGTAMSSKPLKQTYHRISKSVEWSVFDRILSDLPVVHEMYTWRYHFDPFESVASRPGHHIDAEFHARRDIQEKRRRAIYVQFHGLILIHGRTVGV